ncbi:MAG TPA: NADH-quinone oxidoreductase subunit NuoN, partial [Candidatus Limnocylindrales bacterium]|nr:NADH-quinone oxidoreductase subunit NuoN [Candidatus Limnocylindrales bacterium]
MAETLTFPSFQYRAMAPMLIVLVAGVVSVLIEGLAPRATRRALQLVLVLSALAAALALTIAMPASELGVVAAGSLSVDGPTLFMWVTILVIALLATLLMAEKRVDPAGDAFAPRSASLVGSAEEQELTKRGWDQTEVWPLFLFAVSGMLLFPAATDLLMLFVALEVMSLPLYLLAGMARRRRLLSQEAALKYFLLGAFASAFLLYGSAMLFGYAGALDFASIAEAFTNQPGAQGLQLVGIGMVAAGLLFKVAAVPFHMWTPDVYQGSPTPVTAFMAAAVKVAGFGALLRVMYVALGGASWDWEPVMWVVAIVTMLVGVVLAVTSADIKRMLAYSSVGHAGFLLLGVIAFSSEGLASTMFYLLAYGLTTIGCFAIVMLVRSPAGEAGHLSSWAGLGRTSPLTAGVFAFLLLALAG